MSGSGSDIIKEVRVSDQRGKKRKSDKLNISTTEDHDDTSFETTIEELKIDEEADILEKCDVTTQPNGKDKDNIPEISDTPIKPDSSPVTTYAPDAASSENIEDTPPKTSQVLEQIKDANTNETHTQKSSTKIDKLYNIPENDEKSELKGSEASTDVAKTAKSEGKSAKSDESKRSTTIPPTLDQKLLKPKTTLTTLAKMPTLTSGGIGGVRLLSGGVRGTNMPLLVSMGAGTAGIPLLPAGLPPGRYVILPGTSTTTKTTCATVNTTSGTMAPRLATGVTPPVAATSVVSATSTAATVNVVAAAAAARTKSITPTLHIPLRANTRERGRRKSYTTGEKLAMIEAVEAGQRKSTVADRFGVAPSTLACILAQRNKIRAEQQDNLSRRRFRHMKYMQDDGRGSSSSNRVTRSSGVTPTLHTITSTPDQPFTHFLASLTAPSPNVFDSPPEEIIAVPDLMDRLDGGGGGAGHTSGENEMKGHEESDEDREGNQDCLATMQPNRNQSMEIDCRQDVIQNTRQAIRRQNLDALEEANSQENSVRPSTPTNTNQVSGLTGPYLLKKETHCSTVLDQLLRDDTYTDVTLTAEGLSLRAHRIVLCLSSPYFRQVLSREQSVQSVVLLRDVKFAELRNILNFIYTGEATVDAAELESFMRTAEMLEITSLCEGHKFLSSRGLSQGSTASSFTIGDFERLVGTKSSRKDASPSPSKTRRISGEGPPSRCSSTEPTASTNPLTLMNEEPSFIPPSTSHTIKEEIDTTADETPIIAESTDGEGTKPKSEKPRKRRKRMHSSESIGSFAAIAGVQKVSEADDDDEVFPSSAKSSHNQQPEESNKPTLNSDVDNTATPGRCPYCPHVSQTYEGVSMMRHLLVSHPCKPAFPCSFCWRVFVKRTNFKTHLQSCQDSY